MYSNECYVKCLAPCTPPDRHNEYIPTFPPHAMWPLQDVMMLAAASINSSSSGTKTNQGGPRRCEACMHQACTVCIINLKPSCDNQLTIMPCAEEVSSIPVFPRILVRASITPIFRAWVLYRCCMGVRCQIILNSRDIHRGSFKDLAIKSHLLGIGRAV